MITMPLDKISGEFSFKYKGLDLTGTVEDHPEFSNEHGCVLNQGEPYCNFSQLDDLIAYINSQNVTENKIISEAIDEDYGDYPTPTEDEINGGQMEAIYRATPREHLESIFKHGFNRQFTGSHGGNAYGAGTYCMTTFQAALRNTPSYGDTVVKMYVIGGFDHFLIYNSEIAKRVYGHNWRIEDQLKHIFNIPDNIAYKLRGEGSAGAHQDIVKKYGIRAMIYRWGPGYAVNVFDFSCIIPYSVYDTRSQKWKKMFNFEYFNNRMNDNIDVNFRYSQKYKQVFEGVNGFVMVMNDKNKFNFVDIQDDTELSPFWFDMITQPLDKATGEFSFIYKGLELTGTIENHPEFTNEKGCVLNQGEPYCNFSQLDDLIAYINSQQQ